MLTEFHLSNFKSYKTSSLPLGPLTVLIGANAAGKSNAIEGLRLLSWLAQGHKLSSIQYEINNTEGLIRGRINDLCYQGESNFTLGCKLDIPEWNELNITLNIRDGELHIIGEKIIDANNTVPLYELEQPSQGINTDVSVNYNNFTRGKNKPKITCNDQMAIFVQLDSPARFDSKYETSQNKIPKGVK